MRLRGRHTPLLLFLLPTLTYSLPTDADDNAGSIVSIDRRAAVKADAPPPVATPSPSAAGAKPDVGTKDAPVDGLDGKPHAGPFVDTKPKKLPASVEDLGPTPTPKAEISGQTGWKLLEDESVMDDPNRVKPKKGTTGTEGGVSEKDKDRKEQEAKAGGKVEKIPDPPKEAPPAPHDVSQEKLGKDGKDKETKTDESSKPKGAVGLEKPADLPDKPHDIPHPNPPSLPKDEGKEPPATKKPTSTSPTAAEDDKGVIQPLHSFVLSFAMILVSEIGDKTFLVAALMAMRHPRLVVFTGALSALVAMTVLSAVLGHAVPTLLPKRFTNVLAAILFFVFGAKLLREGLAMSPEEGVGEEMKEVEQELEEKEHRSRRNRRDSNISPYVLESGRARRSRDSKRLPTPARSPSSSPSRSPSPNRKTVTGLLSGLNNLFSFLLSPAWVQTFVMTFLGEWGDRSQIATIAMAAGQDYWWVTGGAISGHAICTGVAVIGGRAIAGRVSMRVVTLGGAIAFLVFGFIYMIEAAYSE